MAPQLAAGKPHFTVVGRTTSTEATLLTVFDADVRTAKLEYVIDGTTATVSVDTIDAAPYARAVFQLRDLPPGKKVTYRVNEGAPSSFRLLTPGRPPRVAIVSCNDISSKSYTREDRGRLWRELANLVRAEEVDLILHMGDQIYGDERPEGSLPSETQLQAYRRHYVNTWSHPDVSAALGACPSLMMWDDHEIFDGYGSRVRDSNATAQARFAEAKTAFAEFQAVLNPPSFDGTNSFAWSFVHGGLGVIAIDGRTQRMWADRKVMGAAQRESMEQELQRLGKSVRRLFVIVGTPPVFLPALAVEKATKLGLPAVGDDLRGGWTAVNNREECRWFLETLLEFSSRTSAAVTILGGDIHVATLAVIEKAGRPPITQITSSGIARPPPERVGAFMLGLVAHGGAVALTEEIRGSLERVEGAPKGHHIVACRNFARLVVSDAFKLGVELFVEDEGSVKRLVQGALGV